MSKPSKKKKAAKHKTGRARTRPALSRQWETSRHGAWSGRGYRYQDRVGALFAVLRTVGELDFDELIPEGWEDLSLVGQVSSHFQVKSRLPHRGLFPVAEIADHLVKGWRAHLDREDPTAEFVLVVERAIDGVEVSLQPIVLADLQGAAALRQALQGRAADVADAILTRARLWVVERPEEDCIIRLVPLLRDLPDEACAAHVLALRAAVAEAADANAAGGVEDRNVLTPTDIQGIVTRTTALIDRSALEEALATGACEPVDFMTAHDDPAFWTGVDVVPAHVAAGLPFGREADVDRVVAGMEQRGAALIVGPSGSGKSALLWLSAYAERQVRWYRVRRLTAQDVEPLLRLARALRPTERTPVGLAVDNVGQPGTEGWDQLIGEAAHIPNLGVVGAAREEDVFLLRSLAACDIVRLRLDERLAADVHSELRARGLTAAPHWAEAFDQANGILMEYVHLLSRGRRLSDVLEQQVRDRDRSPERTLELEILGLASVAGAWGGTVPVGILADRFAADPSRVRPALRRLVKEHLLIERDGQLAPVHRLRSSHLRDHVHAVPPPVLADSVRTVLAVANEPSLRAVIFGALTEAIEESTIIDACAARIRSERSASVAASALRGLELVDARRSALRQVELLDAAGVPPAMRVLAGALAAVDSDLGSATSAFDSRFVAGLDALRGEQQRETLRPALAAALGTPLLAEVLAEATDVHHVTRLLAALDGLGDDIAADQRWSSSTRLIAEAAGWSVKDVARTLAAARRASPMLASSLCQSLGGPEHLAERAELETAWLGDVEVVSPEDPSLGSYDVRAVYRYIWPNGQPDPHAETVAAAILLASVLPDVGTVHITAVDPTGAPAGFRDFEIARKSMPRRNAPSEVDTAWHRTRLRVLASVAGASSGAELVAEQVAVLEDVATLLGKQAGTWVASDPLLQKRNRFREERRQVVARAEQLGQVPIDAQPELDPLDAGSDVPLGNDTFGLVQSIAGNLLSRLWAIGIEDVNLHALTAFVRDTVPKTMERLSDPDAWRLAGIHSRPAALERVAAILEQLGDILSEMAAGTLTLADVRMTGRIAGLSGASLRARRLSAERRDALAEEVRERLSKEGLAADVLFDRSQAGITSSACLVIDVASFAAWYAAIALVAETAGLLSDSGRLSALPRCRGHVATQLAVDLVGSSVYPDTGRALEWCDRLGLSRCRTDLLESTAQVVDACVSLSSVLSGARVLEAERAAVEDAASRLRDAEQLLAGESLVDEVARAAQELLGTLVDQAWAEFDATQDPARSEATPGELAQAFLSGVREESDEGLSVLVTGLLVILCEHAVDPEAAKALLGE